MRACIIILNYNDFLDTKVCIESVLQHVNSKEYKLIVVDNGSRQDEIGRLRSLNKEIRDFCLLETGKNLGYAGGNNVGIQYAKANDFEYICVLNNDTIIKEDFLTPCLDVLSRQKKIGFLGPAIIDYKTNKIQSTGGKIDILRGRVDLINSGEDQKRILKDDKIIPCDYVGGACIICRAELLKEIGTIPENYFLFFEETEWCYKALMKGYKNYCVPEVTIVHKGSQSTGHYRGLQEYLMARNRVVFVKRNIGNPFKFILFLMYLLFGNIKRVFKDSKRFMPYFGYYMDGLTGKVDSRYPFVICKTEE